MTITKEEVTKNFKKDLKDLLVKYNADITAKDHYMGYPECGEDIKMIVDIPGIWKDSNQVQEWTEIDLGRYLDKDLT